MRVSVFGLGYVGVVSAGCLTQNGHEVIGVDRARTKVELINSGQSPIIETEIGEIIASAVGDGRLRATEDTVRAVNGTELSFVCVGTPSQVNGNLDLSYIRRVCEEIGTALKDKAARHTVVIRSTILPGTMRGVVIPTLEAHSGKQAGSGFDICHNPEFLREGSAVMDFTFPAKTVIGELNPGSGDLLAELYSKLQAPLIRTDLETSEIIKYIDNGWHALKIGFANEIGNLCSSLSVDAHKAMEIFCLDTKLNISTAYLSPGFAFGGSCLPKDLRALSYAAKSRDLDLPILNSILRSNELQIAKGLHRIVERGNARIGILGFSFKAGTDDLRESPMIEIIERLAGKGYDLRIYDKNVQLAKLVGANRDFILNHIPHISKLMVDDVDAVLRHGETIVIGNKDPDFQSIPERLHEGQCMVDLARLLDIAKGNIRCAAVCQ
ncbi:MAG: nucleotide sugar dehydrogenase [Terriglobia bacterium]